MYTNNAYLNNSTVDRKDKSKPLVITMCGTYKLYTKPKLPTWRPRGRLDFQLLYIAAGKAHFHFGSDTEETIVPAGHMVLYRPKEPQKYEYYANDQTEVFWVHFTGNNVTNLLRSYGLTNDKKVFNCGFDSEYKTLFQSMIKELQMCQDGYPEMLEMEEKITEANLDFRLDIPEDKVIVALDGQKTYRIFENLIGNAAKYAMPHTRVYVKIAAEDGDAVFQMKNVSANELTFNPEEITERFVRGDSSRNTEGSGLGLAIVKSFVEIQKGKFWIETEADLFKAEIRWKLVDKKDDIA